MATNIRDLLDNTKKIFMTDSSVNTLMDFERVIDELDIYAFANWKKGELVDGPIYEKYFVTCTFMWPYKHMPDPRGAERLLQYEVLAKYRKDYYEHPVTVKSPDDFQPGTKVPKMTKSPVWLVEIIMPKKLMQDIHQGAVELEGQSVDAEDIEKAYEEGDHEDEYKDNTGLDGSEEMNGGAPEEPLGGPNAPTA
jgi:hypothetical protein